MNLKVFVFIILIAFQSKASELYNRNLSVRALGMGNAYTAVARGADSLFFNPAGLGSSSGFRLTLLKARAGVNDPENILDIVDTLDAENLEDVLRQFYGEPLNLSGGAYSGLAVSGLAFAVYDSFNVSADLSNPALPDFQLDYVNDFGYAAGFGFELVPSFVSIGFVGKRIERMGASERISVDTLATLETDELKELLKNKGVGYSFDLGVNVTLPTPIKPTFSFVMKDIGDTSFSFDDGISAPPSDQMEMIAGLSFDLSVPGITITPALDYRYLQDSGDINLGKKINFGVEIDIPIIDLRAGFHQGYWTAGLSFNTGIIQFDFASYGVELGVLPGQNEDRRYVFEMTMDFGWDGSLGIGGFFGIDREQNRKLKQRR